jgi:hypothetical protein
MKRSISVKAGGDRLVIALVLASLIITIVAGLHYFGRI